MVVLNIVGNRSRARIWQYNVVFCVQSEGLFSGSPDTAWITIRKIYSPLESTISVKVFDIVDNDIDW